MTDEKKREDKISEEELEDVAGGAVSVTGAAKGGSEAGAIPDVMQTPSPGGSSIPIPFPNSSGMDVGSGAVTTEGKGLVPEGSPTMSGD